MSYVTATVARDFFSEVSVIARGSVSRVSGVITINGVDTNMVAPTLSTNYDTSTAPPILSWIFGGVFEITEANSTITRIYFEGRDNNNRLVTGFEVLTLPDNPITIAEPGLYAVLAVATINPQRTVNIRT